MDHKVSRNAPCPCGSGKKYKKCCGANEVISLTQVLETEIDELQKQLLQFAIRNFGSQMEESFENYEQEFFLKSDNEVQFFEFVHTIWFTLFAFSENGETILDQFIASELRKIRRPKLKQVVQSWKDARVIFGRFMSIEGNSFMVEDLLTHDQFEVIITTSVKKQYEAGTFFAGILLPFDQKFIFFPAPFDLPNLDFEDATAFIKQAFTESNYEDLKEFQIDFFMEMMYDLPEVGVRSELKNMEWTDPVYLEVAGLFQSELEQIGAEQELIDTGIYLWNLFCKKKQKKIKNPNIYVAALHYFMSTIVPTELITTQKELANHYGVSSGSLSAVYRELENTLAEDLDVNEQEPDIQFQINAGSLTTERALQEVLEEIEENNFENIDEINEFLNNRLSSGAPPKRKDEAQELIYDAFEATGNERYRLAEKALKLNPNLVDAYNILAENANSIEEAVQMYEKAMWIGQKELGKAFFKENKGHFWLIFETRPFMRAKANFAEALMQLGKMKEAIHQFEEMLELNPNDNQGVRFSLFIAYVEIGDFTKAEQLLQKYEEDTVHFHFNRLLLEVLEHGFTAKAKTLLKAAKESNKLVISYLNGKKRLPNVIPDYYEFGDENEAIVYVDGHLHLWKKIDGIREWLK
jgi:tetratricopeptide (TPR) repeat protein